MSIDSIDNKSDFLTILNNIDEIKRVLNSGKISNIDVKDDKTGRTTLMKHSIDGTVESVKQLLELGANPNLKDPEGDTSLMRAVQFGDHGSKPNQGTGDPNMKVEKVRLLLKYGANRFIPNNKTNSVLDKAKSMKMMCDKSQDSQCKDKNVIDILMSYTPIDFQNRDNVQPIKPESIVSYEGDKIAKFVDELINNNQYEEMRKTIDSATFSTSCTTKAYSTCSDDNSILDDSQKALLDALVTRFVTFAKIQITNSPQEQERIFDAIISKYLTESSKITQKPSSPLSNMLGKLSGTFSKPSNPIIVGSGKRRKTHRRRNTHRRNKTHRRQKTHRKRNTHRRQSRK